MKLALILLLLQPAQGFAVGATRDARAGDGTHAKHSEAWHSEARAQQSVAHAQESGVHAKQSGPSDEFRTAAATPPTGAPAAFDFEMNGFSYHIAANGNGRRTKGDKTRRFNLRLGGGEDLRRLYFTDYEGDLLLVCEVEGRERAAGVVIRLEQPSMRALWTQEVPPGGVSALRQGGAFYLAGDGMVARLDLKTGAYAWRHLDRREEDEEEVAGKELIPRGRYGAPEVSGDTVTFRLAGDAESARPRAVRVNRKSGKIISIE